MKEKRQKLGLDEEGTRYLDDIFNRVCCIANPTTLEISGFGKIIATSMVLNRFSGQKFESYFTFEKEGVRGEVIRDNTDYFIENYNTEKSEVKR